MPLFIPSTPVYASDPSQVIMDEASPVHQCILLPPGLSKRTREAEAPNPLAGNKHITTEPQELPKLKLMIVDALPTAFQQDQLGRLVASLSAQLASASSWRDFVNEH